MAGKRIQYPARTLTYEEADEARYAANNAYVAAKVARDAAYAASGDEADYNRLQVAVDKAWAVANSANRDYANAHARKVARYESEYGIEY